MCHIECWGRIVAHAATYLSGLSTNISGARRKIHKDTSAICAFYQSLLCSLKQRGCAEEWNYPLVLAKVKYKKVLVLKHTERTQSNNNYNLDEVSVQQSH
jgi:hypothetical protein